MCLRKCLYRFYLLYEFVDFSMVSSAQTHQLTAILQSPHEKQPSRAQVSNFLVSCSVMSQPIITSCRSHIKILLRGKTIFFNFYQLTCEYHKSPYFFLPFLITCLFLADYCKPFLKSLSNIFINLSLFCKLCSFF